MNKKQLLTTLLEEVVEALEDEVLLETPSLPLNVYEVERNNAFREAKKIVSTLIKKRLETIQSESEGA